MGAAGDDFRRDSAAQLVHVVLLAVLSLFFGGCFLAQAEESYSALGGTSSNAAGDAARRS